MKNDARESEVGCTRQALRSTLRCVAAGIAVVALVSPLLARADCVDTRKPSAAEIDFHNRAWAALVATLPPVPVGATARGQLESFERVPTMGEKCADEKVGAFDVTAQRAYEIKPANAYYYQLVEVRLAMNVRQFAAAGDTPSGAYGTASPGRSVGLKVHNVVWSVSGSKDSTLREAVAGALDRARLEAMVGKPLPSVAQSKAFAAQAVPATVATAAVAAPAVAAPPAQSAAQATTANTSAPAAPASPAAAEPMKDAVDTMNKLRGLFGR